MRSDSVITLPSPVQPGAIQPKSSARLAEARQRLPINLLANITWLVLNMMVGLWYTPYLIGHLGVAVYGLVPLAISVTNYMSILTDGFNSAVSRFLMIDLARDDTRAANRTFNTAVAGSSAIIAILFPIALLMAWLSPRLFNVPLGYEQDARWLVWFTMLAFITTAFASNFAISSYAHHRFDLRLLVNVIRLGAQVASIVVLFRVLSPQLWQVGFALFLSAILLLVGHGALWRRLTPDLRIKLDLVDVSRLRHILGFSGWVLINQTGSLLFLNIDLIVANLIFGARVAGQYGAVVIFPTLLRTLLATVDGVLVPIVVTLYAQNNPTGLVRFCRQSVKLIGLAISLPVGLLCGLARPLLTVWLGPEFSDLSWLVVALVGHLCINLAVIPLFSIQVATNNVRVPGMVTLVMGVANTILAVTLAKWSGWGYISIAIAGAVALTAKNALFTPLYNARILRLPWWTFLPSLVAGSVGCLAIGLGTYWMASIWTLASWGQLALAAGITSGIYLGTAYCLGLNADERHLLISEIRRGIKRWQ